MKVVLKVVLKKQKNAQKFYLEELILYVVKLLFLKPNINVLLKVGNAKKLKKPQHQVKILLNHLLKQMKKMELII